MNKKLLIVCIAVLLAFTAFAQSENDFEYSMAIDNSGWWIMKYNGTAAKVTVPAKKDGKPVLAIDGMAFYDNKTITTLIIPEGIVEIGDGELDEDEEYILHWGAFTGCENLSSVKLPGTLNYIGINAFVNCTNLTSITIPKGVKYLGKYSFANTGLKSITLPDTLEGIGSFAFFKCFNLKSVVIPGTVKKIDVGAFFECDSLSSVKLKEGTVTIAQGAFANCPAIREIALPASIEEIFQFAFANCSSLTTIKIPPAVKSLKIEEDAFSGAPLNDVSAALLKKYGYIHR